LALFPDPKAAVNFFVPGELNTTLHLPDGADNVQSTRLLAESKMTIEPLRGAWPPDTLAMSVTSWPTPTAFGVARSFVTVLDALRELAEALPAVRPTTVRPEMRIKEARAARRTTLTYMRIPFAGPRAVSPSDG
jgi:hypothetical protein